MLSGYLSLFRLLALVALFSFISTFVLADQINDHKTILKSASELDYPLFAIVHLDGTAGGFSVELLKAVVQAADLHIQIERGNPCIVYRPLAAP